MAEPVTRESLREELAALWSDFQRAINDLELHITRQTGPVTGLTGYYSEGGRDLHGEFGPTVGTMPSHQPPAPHQWVQRHIRSYAVACEMAETHDGLNEGRLTPVHEARGQAPHKHVKGQGPLSQAIRRAATVADAGDRKKFKRFRTKAMERKVSDGNSEQGADVVSNNGESQGQSLGFIQQAWDVMSTTLRRGVTQRSVAESEVSEAAQTTGGVTRSDTRTQSGQSKPAFESGPSVGVVFASEERHPFQVNQDVNTSIVPVAEVATEDSDYQADNALSDHNATSRRYSFRSALTSIVESTTTLANATRSTLPVPEAEWWLPYFCQRIVHNVLFEYLVLILVVANAVTIGFATDFMARHVQDRLPQGFQTTDKIFSVFFLLELVMRVVSDGCWFWCGPARWWNLTDVVIVSISVVEEIFSLLDAETGLPFALSLMRMLRFLRLVRVIRVMRLLKYISELRTIVTSLTSSLKPLLSSMLLMFLVVYIVGIYLTQLVLNHRLSLQCDASAMALAASTQAGPCFDAIAMVEHFGDVGSAVLGLFQAVTGGVDWGDMVRPLMQQISPIMGVLFSFYIVFTALALMNIVTGVFVETALAKGHEDKDVYMINHLRDLFLTLDLNHNGIISWSELQEHLDNPKLTTFLKEIDLDVSEASGLFRLLDKDQSGMIDADEFLSGCVRLRGPAKALDLQLVMRELAEQHNMLLGLQSAIVARSWQRPPPTSGSFRSANGGVPGGLVVPASSSSFPSAAGVTEPASPKIKDLPDASASSPQLPPSPPSALMDVRSPKEEKPLMAVSFVRATD